MKRVTGPHLVRRGGTLAALVYLGLGLCQAPDSALASDSPSRERIVFGVGTGTTSPAVSPQPELSDELLAVLRASVPGERVRVIAYLREQGLSPSDLHRLQALPKAQRRSQGVAHLQALARTTQTGLLAALASWNAEGRAGEARSLWIVNAVAVDLEAELVFTLLSFPEIRKVAWDPFVDPASMADGESLRGAGRGTVELGDGLDPAIAQQLTQINAPGCWALGYDGTGVVVAIVDYGVDPTHADLAGRLWTNPGEIAANGIDDDENGFIDDVNGWDFLSDPNDNNPMEEGSSPHGTCVCGIICGTGAAGIATGVAPGAQYIPIRSAGTAWSPVFEGLGYAVLMGADIISMSLTQKWDSSPKPDYAAWRAVAENELALGIIHANSASNKGDEQHTAPIPFNVSAPGNCPSPWLSPYQYLVGGATSVVTVGGVDQYGVISDNSARGPSNWEDIHAYWPQYTFSMPPEYQDYPWSTGLGGLTKPDLVAPSVMTLSTGLASLGQVYVPFSGTSAATPHIAGAMAILLQARPTLTPFEIDRALQYTAVDLGDPGKDSIYGAGIVDCYAALLHVLSLDNLSTLSLTVRDAASLDSLPESVVRLLPSTTLQTNELGQVSTPIGLSAGTFIVEHFGYRPDTTQFLVQSGTDYDFTVDLDSLATMTLSGVVRDPEGAPLPGATVQILETPLATVTDSTGTFTFAEVPTGFYTAAAFKFNYTMATDTLTAEAGIADSLDFTIPVGMDDDFEFDQGWTVGQPGDGALLGLWERCDPVPVYFNTLTVQPGDDHSPEGTHCYITQNANLGASQYLTDVDRGPTSLVSPLFDGTLYDAPILSYRRWYTKDTGALTNVAFKTDVSTNAGQTWTNVETISTSNRSWVESVLELASFVTLTDSMQIRFVVEDGNSATTVVEAGVDEVRIFEITTDVSDPLDAADSRLALRLFPGAPNPFAESTRVRFQLPARDRVRLEVFDVQGRRVRVLVDGALDAGAHQVPWDGRDDRGHDLASGLYFYRLQQRNQQVEQRTLRIR